MSNDLNKTYRKPLVRTVFFAARKIQRSYFSKLSSRIPDSSVIYYKQCIFPALKSIPASKIKSIVQDLIQEKRNNPKRRNKSDLYWKLFRIFKRLEASWLYLVYSRELTISNAGKMVIWNGLKYRQLIAVAAAQEQKIQCIYMENGLLPGYTTLDAQGINYVNSVPRDPSFFRNYNATAALIDICSTAHTRSNASGPTETRHVSGIRKSKKYVRYRIMFFFDFRCTHMARNKQWYV